MGYSKSIYKKTNSDYGSSIEGENYYLTTFNYTDIMGVSQKKEKKSNTLVPTGQTTSVNNIYDFGGNLTELTTESYSNTSCSYTNRGGAFNGTYLVDDIPGYRDFNSGNASRNIGFRITLFL